MAKVAGENNPRFIYVKGVWEDTAKYRDIALMKDGHHPTPFGDGICRLVYEVLVETHKRRLGGRLA